MLEGLLHLLYPNVCAGCERLLEEGEEEVCKNCTTSFDAFSGFEASEAALLETLRRSHPEYPPPGSACALYRFHKDDRLQGILHRMKYDGVFRLGAFFGKRLGEMVVGSGRMPGFDAVVPVPLHRIRRIERTYNQSEAIACAAASVLGGKVRTDLVFRRKYTMPQAGLSPMRRKRNVADAFVPSGKSVPRSVLLVDDVLTTGSTAVAVMRALETAGVGRVSLAVVSLATA